MKEIPQSLKPYKKTQVFTESSIPQGLLNNHNTKEGVWGKINVLEGELVYTIQSNPQEVVLLNSQCFGVVEPTVLHNVKPKGTVKFYIEFYK